MILHSKLLWFTAGLTVSQRLILLRPSHANDAALLAHERCHQQQMARVGTLRWWRSYMTWKAFRQEAEIQSYRVQIVHGASPEGCARCLSTM